LVAGSQAVEKVLGKTRVVASSGGGGGLGAKAWTADKAELVFFPPTGELRVWWSMAEAH